MHVSYLINGLVKPDAASGCQPPFSSSRKDSVMGSLSEFAQGSAAFGLNSGSTIADFATNLPALFLMILDSVGFGASADLTASVGDGPLG